MYLIRVRNYAVCLDGDTQEFLRDHLKDAIRDTITTVYGGPNRIGTVTSINFPGQKGVSPTQEPLMSFYSCNGDHVQYTDYRQSEVEKRFGILGSFMENDVERLSTS